MDNFHLDLTSKGQNTLRQAMQLFNNRASKVAGYRVCPERGMILYWCASRNGDDVTMLPFKMTLEQAADFAYQWLQEADYGTEPDHDGDNEKGFRLYCEGWGHVNNDYSAFAAVKPAWAMYGK